MRRSHVIGSTSLLVALVGVGVLRGWFVLRRVPSHDAYWRRRAAEQGDLLYVALGDSTAQGVGARRPEKAYVGRLAADLAAREGRTVRTVNLGVSGARVGDLVRDQLPVLRRLIAEGAKPDLVTVTIGANDTGRTSTEEFERAMGTVVDALPAGSRVGDVPYFRGRKRGDDARAFSDVIARLVAARDDLVLAPVHVATTGLGPTDYAADLFHPSVKGYGRYYRAFCD